eukprot:1157320-Pelagomonas_calceolata.AAC.5
MFQATPCRDDDRGAHKQWRDSAAAPSESSSMCFSKALHVSSKYTRQHILNGEQARDLAGRSIEGLTNSFFYRQCSTTQAACREGTARPASLPD